MALDQRRTFAAEDHQSFFVLPRRVPSHRFTRLEADETAAHARRLRQPFQQGQSPFGQASAIVSGCGFGIWEESETAATNNPTGTLKMCGSAMRLMLLSSGNSLHPNPYPVGGGGERAILATPAGSLLPSRAFKSGIGSSAVLSWPAGPDWILPNHGAHPVWSPCLSFSVSGDTSSRWVQQNSLESIE